MPPIVNPLSLISTIVDRVGAPPVLHVNPLSLISTIVDMLTKRAALIVNPLSLISTIVDTYVHISMGTSILFL